MTIRMSEQDIAILNEIRKWLVFDADSNLVLRNDAPENIRRERERLAKKYPSFD